MFVGPNQYLPDWFKNGTYTKPALDKMLKDLIQNVIQTNGNDQKVNMWNIVNEAINWKGDGWEQAKWTELGFENDASGLTGQDKVFATVPVFIRKAFEYARLVTNKELELRDYDNDGLENQWNNSAQKSIMFYQLTKHLLAVGAPVTAVGFQGHFSIDNSVTWSKITNQVKKFKSLGLKVFITEMDAEQNGNVKTWNATIAERQKEYYYRYAKAALAGGVDGIFTWGIRDNQDPGWLNGENALLFDANGNPKPAYYGIQKAFSEDITLSINTKQQANLFPRAFRLFVIKDNSSTIIDGGQNHANGIFYCDLLGQRIKERGSSFGLDH